MVLERLLFPLWFSRQERIQCRIRCNGRIEHIDKFGVLFIIEIKHPAIKDNVFSSLAGYV